MIAPVDRTAEFCAAISLIDRHGGKKPPADRGFSAAGTDDASAVSEWDRPLVVTDAFAIESYELARRIDAMKTELETQSRRYCDFSGRGFTDAARDRLDASATAFLRACVTQIDVLKGEAVAGRGGPASASVAAHQLGSVAILNERLRSVSAVAERMRAARIREAVSAAATASAMAAARGRVKDVAFRESAAAAASGGQNAQMGGPEVRADSEAEAAEIALHAQEFARENAALVTEFVERREQVREAERTVSEIAGLNQLFAAKVLEQAKDIETLYDLAVEATTFVDRGNRELRKMKGKGPRVKFWIAFGILVLAAAILILDWLSSKFRIL